MIFHNICFKLFQNRSFVRIADFFVIYMLYNIKNKCLKICMVICNSVYLYYKIKQQFKTKDYDSTRID